MNMTGAHDEDGKCFSGKSNRLATAMEVQSDIAGIVGDTWEQCCQPRARLTFLFNHPGPQAAYPWNVVTNSQLGWQHHVMEKEYEIKRYDGRFLYVSGCTHYGGQSDPPPFSMSCLPVKKYQKKKLPNKCTFPCLC